ncbi:hypothetical protein GGE07_003878 [Sinorhizobium terangae]|nr:hypothetical protein [Sinorhizobium terangae]
MRMNSPSCPVEHKATGCRTDGDDNWTIATLRPHRPPHCQTPAYFFGAQTDRFAVFVVSSNGYRAAVPP